MSNTAATGPQPEDRSETLPSLGPLQMTTLAYYVHECNRANGLVRDKTDPGARASIAAVGLTLASIPVLVERKLISRASAPALALRSLRFFRDSPQGPQPDATGYDIQLLADGTLLLVDASLDLVAVVSWTGQVLWSAGRGSGPDLQDPHSAQRLDDGSILICDTGNSRVLRIDRNGRVVNELQMLRCGPVCYRFNRPRYAEITGDGSWLVVDTGNNRIVGANPEGEFAWELSHLSDSQISWLNQPRWARWINQDELLVTDHLHHRVLHLRCASSPSP